MQLRRIVTLDLADHDLDPEDWNALGALTGELVRTTGDDPALADQLATADAILVQLGVTVDETRLAAAPQLRYVGVFGTSLGRVDLDACARRGITVRNVPGFSTHAVAELAIAIALDHLRGLASARRRAFEGDLSEARPLGRELRGLAVGVVGLGAIGSRVASILDRGFQASVHHWTRTPRVEPVVPAMPLDALLTRSEVVTVHLALAPETRGLLDATRIARLPRGALLVHLSPLELLDLSAVIARLRDGTLHFATDHGDELAPEDLATLRDLERCALYPPIGYGTTQARATRIEQFLSALREATR